MCECKKISPFSGGCIHGRDPKCCCECKRQQEIADKHREVVGDTTNQQS